GIQQQQMYRYALVLAAIDFGALCLYAFISFRTSRGYATWAVRAPASQTGAVRIPWYALFTPVLPVVLYFVVRMDPIPAFILSSIYGVALTRPRNAVPVLVAAVIRGVEDVAPAIVLFIGIGMLFTATKQPQFVAAMQPLASVGLRNPLLYVAIFGVLSPLTLYRGPLNPFGVGIAVFTVLLASHALPPVILVAAVMAVVQVQNVCDPTNTQNVWVANFTGVPINEITRRTLPYQAAVATAACLATVAAAPALFGIHPFNMLVQRADAAALVPPGLFVTGRGAYRIGVGDDGTPDAHSAISAVVEAMAGSGVHAFAARGSPNATDCSAKDYAAYIQITSTRFVLVEGTDVDVGVKLIDCGGWDVTEFHDHAVLAQPTDVAVRQLALQGAGRLHEWAGRFPQRWLHLMAQGLAYQAGDPPAYYYALFKTVDGNMRAYVRAGGPAYAAGMRTNDIIEKLDGLYWWEYGTFQTQARAYDGRAHRFEIQRDGQTLQVQLGEAFTT
ncbi:MAG TPA: hypothetical protein VFE17_13265, partial [Candidatus Baltobacteraceae bacterium]|nr:hypothetical protein [Candidatus Baltobacteraceae bacterium]